MSSLKERTTARGGPRSEMAIAGEILTGSGPQATGFTVVTRDLAAGGVLCEAAEPLPEGEVVTVRLTLPGEATGASGPLAVQATVTRVEGAGPYLLALRFSDPRSAGVATLKRFLFRARDRATR